MAINISDNIAGHFLDRGGGAFINSHHPEFGVVGDGETDDTAALQAAINAAGRGGTVFCRGRVRITDTIKVEHDFLEIIGAGAHKGTGSAAPNALLCELLGPGQPALHLAGTAPRLSNLTIVGKGIEAGGVAIECHTTLDLDRMEFLHWGTAVRHGPADYSTWRAVTMRHCEYGIVPVPVRGRASRLNNMTLDSCQFRRVHYALDSPQIHVLNLKVLGGSYEGYRRAFRYNGDASFFGTYFETTAAHAQEGVDVSGIRTTSGGTVNCFGIFVDLRNTARFFDFGGLRNVHVMVLGSRVYFDASKSRIEDPNFIAAPSSAQHFEVRGTRWDVHPEQGGAPSHVDIVGRGNFKVEQPGDPHVYYARPVTGAALTSAPHPPRDNTIYIADGRGWDPTGRGGGPYPVFFDGSRYHPMI